MSAGGSGNTRGWTLQSGGPPRSALFRAAVLLGAAALILAVMLGLGWVVTRVVPGSGLGGLDLAIDVWLAEHRTPTLDVASTVATDLCSTTSVFVLGFLAAAGSAALLRRWWPAVLLPVALVGELWLFLATAMIVKRPRPPVAHVDAALPPTSSFPSGHTGAAICLFGGIAVIVVCTVRAWWRWLVVAMAAVVVVAVAPPGCTGAPTTSPTPSAPSCWRCRGCSSRSGRCTWRRRPVVAARHRQPRSGRNPAPLTTR